MLEAMDPHRDVALFLNNDEDEDAVTFTRFMFLPDPKLFTA